MKKFQCSTGTANGLASCDSDSAPPPPCEGRAAEHVSNVKEHGTRKKPTSDTKTLWVKTFRCFGCGKSSHTMPKCRQCSQAYYCGADCQRKHWPKHTRSCKAAVAALARHAHRERLARAVREKGKAKVRSTEDDDLCVICQAKPVDPVEVIPNTSWVTRDPYWFREPLTYLASIAFHCNSFRVATSTARLVWRSYVRKAWTSRAPSAESLCRPGRRSSSTWVAGST